MSGSNQGNPANAIPVYNAPAPAGAQASIKTISTDATTTIKTGAGTLSQVAIGTIGTGWSLTFYDATSATGTPIFVLTPTEPTTLPLGLPFTTGLTVVTAGSAAGNAAISYY